MTNLPPSAAGPADSDASSTSGPVEPAAASPYRAADSAAPTPYGAPASPYGAPAASTVPAPAPSGQAGGQSPYPPQQTQPPFPQQQPYAGQPPQGQAQFSYPPQQGPYGHPGGGPVVAKTTNGPGLAALIIGIICMVIAILPTGNFGLILLSGVGVTLGIIGLVLPARPRKQALWGLILSGASIIVGIITAFVYAFGSVLTYY